MIIEYIKDRIDYQYECWLENEIDLEVEFKLRLSKLNLGTLEEIDNEPLVNVDFIMEKAIELFAKLQKEEGIQKELVNSKIQRFELEDYLKMYTNNYLILKKIEAIFIYLYKKHT